MLHLPKHRISHDITPKNILESLYKLLDNIVNRINTKILIKFTVDYLYIPDNLEVKEAEKLSSTIEESNTTNKRLFKK
jgi:hypothetical protein